jgi:RNA polymerase sigma factor (TIGR02999 family)
MENPDTQDISVILNAAADGDSKAAAELLPLVYDELRKLARSHLARNAPGNTLQPTALVHEAYLRLVGSADPGWKNRGHFFASAALAMRRIIVDRARQKGTLKRGGDRKRLDGDDIDALVQAPTEQILAVDEALSRLEKQDPRKGHQPPLLRRPDV